MKNKTPPPRSHERWAHFRFSVIGPLLAAPPATGQLQQRLAELARQKWRHPSTGQWTLFGFSTIESWYYKALRSKQGPVQALQRKIRSDQGQHPAISELFEKDVRTINEHLVNVFAEGELRREATIRKFRIVRTEGKREVAREIEHYNLDAILAVGFRVRNHRGTQFRQWAIGRLNEYLVKGFTMDDERLKNPPGKGQKDYFDEQLERIRDIRSSERRFYQKVLDIYATSVDYTPNTEVSQQFFATVQNKMHWAGHGQTAAEVIHARVDSGKPYMGLKTTRPGGIIRKEDVSIAKNYLDGGELDTLNRIVTAYIEFAELRALQRKVMTMRDWITKLDEFLKLYRLRRQPAPRGASSRKSSMRWPTACSPANTSPTSPCRSHRRLTVPSSTRSISPTTTSSAPPTSSPPTRPAKPASASPSA
jgi:hypothetical protein